MPKNESQRSAVAPTVLVVDDQPDTRAMLRELLEWHGYSVREAGDGAEALRVITDEAVSILITDLYMPGMDGIQLLRHLKSSDATPVKRVIAMSGVYHLGQPSTTAAASLLGADAVLDKPFTRYQLLQALAVVIDNGPSDPRAQL